MSDEIIQTPAEEEELSQEEVNSLKQIRIDKLNALKAKGADPFEITRFDVTSSNAKATIGLFGSIHETSAVL